MWKGQSAVVRVVVPSIIEKVSANTWTRFSRLSTGHKIKLTSTPAVPFVRKWLPRTPNKVTIKNRMPVIKDFKISPVPSLRLMPF